MWCVLSGHLSFIHKSTLLHFLCYSFKLSNVLKTVIYYNSHCGWLVYGKSNVSAFAIKVKSFDRPCRLSNFKITSNKLYQVNIITNPCKRFWMVNVKMWSFDISLNIVSLVVYNSDLTSHPGNQMSLTQSWCDFLKSIRMPPHGDKIRISIEIRCCSRWHRTVLPTSFLPLVWWGHSSHRDTAHHLHPLGYWTQVACIAALYVNHYTTGPKYCGCSGLFDILMPCKPFPINNEVTNTMDDG